MKTEISKQDNVINGGDNVMKDIELWQGDCLELMKDIPDESVHLVLSDIPYGISFADWDVLHSNTNSALGGNSPAQDKAGSVFKTRGKPINGWSEADKKIPKEYQEWCSTWAPDWYRVLKPGANVFIFAGRRYAHRAIIAMEDSGFNFRDMIAWKKEKATYRAQRISKVYERRTDFDNAEKLKDWRVGNLKPIFEPILWFTKPYKQGGTIADNMLVNGVGAYNGEKWKMYTEDCSNTIEIKSDQHDRGSHPTQKPVELMRALIELTTQENQIVLDPFMGSGTTGVACKNLNRKFIGIELDENYFEIAKNRVVGTAGEG